MQFFYDQARNVFNPATFIGAIFYALVLIVLAWIIGKILHTAICRYVDRITGAGKRSTALLFLEQLIKVAVYVLIFLWYTRLVPALQSFSTAWLASLGIASVVVGLATQSTLSNIVAGISLVLYKPFRVGDTIQITSPTGPEIGRVESIDLGYTSIRTTDKRRLVVPNSLIAGQATINLSQSAPNIPCDTVVVVTNDSDLDKACKILIDISKSIPKIANVIGCFVTDVKSGGTTVTLSAVCADPRDVTKIKSDILGETKKQFNAAAIKIAG